MTSAATATPWTVDPRPLTFWGPGSAPRHAPADLVGAFEGGVAALVVRPKHRSKIELRGVHISLAKVCDLLWRSHDPLPYRIAICLAALDPIKGHLWTEEGRTLAEAARFIRALIVF